MNTMKLFLAVGIGFYGAVSAVRAEPAEALTPDTADGGLQEIVVTAEKRTESAQRAPLAVTSISAAELDEAHVTGVEDLTRVVPDVHVDVGGATGDPGGANALFTIRGLGASATGPQGSPGVAVHVDGIFRQNGLGSAEFFDLQRIEVDPGPQGTLYGRSAAAGAVNVITNAPTQTLAAEATVEAGNYGEVRTEGMLNLPINSVLAVRGAFQTIKHDGYFSNGYDDQDAKAGRLQALLTPTDELSIRLYGDYMHLGGTGTSGVFVAGPGFAQLTTLLPQVVSGNSWNRSIAQYCVIDGRIEEVCGQHVDTTKYSTHIDLEYNLGWGILTVLPSFAAETQYNTNGGAPAPLSGYQEEPYDQNQTNFEIRLNDVGTSAVKWVVGANYYNNHDHSDITQNINVLEPLRTPVGATPGAVSIVSDDDLIATQRSYAAFGQITYPVLDIFRATAGVRYNHDSSSYKGSLATLSEGVYALNGPLLATPVPKPITTGSLTSEASYNDVTYRVALDADVGPASIVYGSVSSGYKPGGLNDGGLASSNTPQELALLSGRIGLPAAQLATLASPPSFGPEKVTHFELGTKNRFWNNRLEINDAVYYDNYRNYQNSETEVVNPLFFLAQGFTVTNAGTSRVYGDELSVKYEVTQDDLLAVALNYLRGYFTRYDAPPYLTPSGAIPAQSYTGKPLPNAPLFSGNVSYGHTFVLPDGGHIVASVFTHLTDGYWTYFAEAPGTYQSHFSSTTLDLTWKNATDRWRVSAFVKNLEDKTIISNGQSTAGFSDVDYSPPRTFGASVTLKLF